MMHVRPELLGRSTVLLGTPVDDVTLDEAVEEIIRLVKRAREDGRARQVTTVNADFIVNARADPAVLGVMQRSDLAIPDGIGVVWGSRLVGSPVRERTAGADLVPALIARAATEDLRVCLYGGAPGVAARAADLLRRANPGADVIGIDAPMIANDGAMDLEDLTALTAIDADIIGVALGNPKQEMFIARHGQVTGAGVLIGIGGTLNFLTGTTLRAPTWVQRFGLEWLHRAIAEPRRLAGRYARDIVVFCPLVAMQMWRGRRTSRRNPASPASGLLVEGSTVRLSWEQPVLDERFAGREFVVNGLGTTRLDNALAASLIGFARRARRHRATVRVRGVGPKAAAQLRAIGIEVDDA